jgi:hypothetical protein
VETLTTKSEPKGKLDTMAMQSAAMLAADDVVNGPEDEPLDWHAIDWRAAEDDVRRLRQRIFTASRVGLLPCQAAFGACLSRMRGKRASPVLRGAGRSNAPGLPGELIGEFKNAGRDYRPAGSPVPVNVHDFLDPALGKAIPYGVYDIGANTGWVSVGSDHDTAAFAVATLRNWWEHEGHGAYPNAERLLITADGGGSGGARLRAWKSELAAFAATTGLSITVCHIPPGTSKWNKIEHRLFAHITMNWRGAPLTSHQTVVNLIGAVTTTPDSRFTPNSTTITTPPGSGSVTQTCKPCPCTATNGTESGTTA